MEGQLKFDASDYNERTLRLIMAKAEQWGVTPAEAVVRLLDELAKKSKVAA